MKFLYATDLHGDIKKYEDIKQFAISENIKLIHLGADILPKGSEILKNQKIFINTFLKSFYKECLSQGITLLTFFGNDDIYSRKKYFKQYFIRRVPGSNRWV